MKTTFRLVLVVSIIFLFTSLIVTPALALQDTPAPPTLPIAWSAFLALVGWPAFQVAFNNILKYFKVIKDGTADKWTYVESGVVFIGVAILVFTGKYDLLASIDLTLGRLAGVLVSILVLLSAGTASLAVNRFIYTNVRGVPLIGFSHELHAPMGVLSSVPEQLVPGDYTSLIDLNIRKQMDAKSYTNYAGAYMRSLPFFVYEVYPEDENGIVWGRVSSNTGFGTARYVALRVTNIMKAKLEKAFDLGGDNKDQLTRAVEGLTTQVQRLADK